MKRLSPLAWSILAAAVVIIDEAAKWTALQRLPDEGSLSGFSFVSLAIHKNPGIAFDIPFRMPIILAVSAVIGAFLAQIAYKNRHRHPNITAGALIIIIGALGNLYDRLAYGFTVDYVILLNRLAINLSDAVIVTGVIVFLLASRRSRAHKREHPDEPRA